jgi:hypothetical protein
MNARQTAVYAIAVVWVAIVLMLYGVQFLPG